MTASSTGTNSRRLTRMGPTTVLLARISFLTSKRRTVYTHLLRNVPPLGKEKQALKVYPPLMVNPAFVNGTAGCC
jgi:hypothetical protein